MMEYLPGDNGTNAEEMEREAGARARIQEYWKSESQISNLRGTELSLLKQMLTAPEDWRKEGVWLMADFLDREEAHKHIAAFYEAEDLGMDTSFNIAYMFAVAAANDKVSKTNRVASLLDAVSHFRMTTNQPRNEAEAKKMDTKRGPLS